jgi:predicted phage terminase large subunit-like protein
LIGRITAEPGHGWEVVNLPAIAEDNDAFGRNPGVALWPEFKSAEFLQSQREAMGDYEFEALFQGNPTPREGSLFQVARIGKVARPKGQSILSFDVGSTIKGDPTAMCQLWKVAERYVLEFDQVQKETYDRNSWIRLQSDTRRPTVITIPEDPGAGGKDAAVFLTATLAGHYVKTKRPTKDKETRANPLSSMVNAGLVDFVDNHMYAKAVEQFRSFPGGKHDDMVDAASDAFSEANYSPRVGGNDSARRFDRPRIERV